MPNLRYTQRTVLACRCHQRDPPNPPARYESPSITNHARVAPTKNRRPRRPFCDSVGLRPDRTVRDTFDDATLDRLASQFALAPMTDRYVERLGIFTGQGHDLADYLGCEPRWCPGPWRVVQTRRHAGGCLRVHPTAPPRAGGLAPDPQFVRCLFNPKAARGQQNDPRPLRQLLW